MARISARLADSAFRKDAEAALGADPDWGLALQQNANVRKRPEANYNHLF